MFTSGLKETTETRVVLKDVSAPKFKTILTYIYTGQIYLTNLSEAEIVNHIALAHLYQINDLANSIASSLESGLNLNNAVHRLTLSDLYGLGKLKTACLNFMEDNASAVLKTTGCLRLSEVRRCFGYFGVFLFSEVPSGGLTLIVGTQKWGFYCKVHS
jgi:hypothetical protein